MSWLDALKLAVPLAGIGMPIIWALIVYHGDGRWVRRPESFTKDGEPRWPSKEALAVVKDSVVEVARSCGTHSTMLLGQNDSIADHEARVIRLEERDVRDILSSITLKLDDMNSRIIRLEDVPRRLEAIETRITQNRLKGEPGT